MLIGKKTSFSVTFGLRPYRKFGVEIAPEKKWCGMSAEEKEGWQEVTVFFHPLTFGLNNYLRAQAEYTDPNTNMRAFNWERYQETKLCKTIMSWTLTERGPEGEPIPVEPSDENVKRLHPEIAKYLLEVYQEETELSEEEEGN